MYKPKIRIKLNNVNTGYKETKDIAQDLNLNTVCQEASCPNIQECWGKKHASFMIMGDICTRKCSFCNIKTGKPMPLDPKEPIHIAMAVKNMGLKHVVITSVDRDDLLDGGANHFTETIFSIRAFSPKTTIEVLTPDFLKKGDAYKQVVHAKPDVFSHNIETVPSLYRSIRPVANYFNSLMLLKKVKEEDPEMFTKSGFMVGLGETDNEILELMDDARNAEIDFITIGQYLQPTKVHAPVKRYVEQDKFDFYAKQAKRKGFLIVSSSPLTRSSYHADEHFNKLKEARLKMKTFN
ncbi:MAG: lipoyl synthase [Alphaproteobacteria bacterium]|nr:lipoyl synthase [Rickettsiales bacterium]